MILAGGSLRIASFLALPVTIAGVTFLLLAGLQALATGARHRARNIVVWAFGAIVLYAVILVAVSLASTESVLDPGREKVFCGADCDLSVSIASLMPATAEIEASRAFYVKL